MKLVIASVISFLSLSAFADSSCVNLNGVYRIDSITAMRVLQNECKTLKLAYGEIQQTGRVDWYKNSVEAAINGPASCKDGYCVTAKVVGDQMQLFNDKTWSSYNTEHGYCYFNQEFLSVNAQGALVRNQDVRYCEDGFSGKFESTLTRMN